MATSSLALNKMFWLSGGISKRSLAAGDITLRALALWTCSTPSCTLHPTVGGWIQGLAFGDLKWGEMALATDWNPVELESGRPL